MNESDLLALMKECLGLKEIKKTDGMGLTRGWDSLAHVQLIIELEARTGRHLSGDLIAKLVTVEALLGHFSPSVAPTV